MRIQFSLTTLVLSLALAGALLGLYVQTCRVSDFSQRLEDVENRLLPTIEETGSLQIVRRHQFLWFPYGGYDEFEVLIPPGQRRYLSSPSSLQTNEAGIGPLSGDCIIVVHRELIKEESRVKWTIRVWDAMHKEVRGAMNLIEEVTESYGKDLFSKKMVKLNLVDSATSARAQDVPDQMNYLDDFEEIKLELHLDRHPAQDPPLAGQGPSKEQSGPKK